MNDRILELLYEAGGQYGGEHFTTGQTVIYTEEVDYEKFAELIQQDCLQHLTNTGQDHAREILERYFAYK